MTTPEPISRPDAASDPASDDRADAGVAGAPTWRLAKPVVLIGLMGAGKTSVGRRLAATLATPFVDSDEEVERAARMTIPEIFAQYGEPEFRDGERRVISRLLERGPQIIATGGGAWMNALTREAIRERGATVCWLRAELDTLLGRVMKKGGATRPLLATGDPRKTLSDLMAVRYPVYAEADVTVDSHAGERHEAVVARILEALAARGEAQPI
ncbi:shikimate kinase [Albimonas sp. CAU 1670]|uniref:shikimate kinase n=1 Tax=Albimonas sp. CAU 1670 TaxID=3032599 RepID=UPI0023DBB7B9|nr:shikimate kinase [Albimonas sp. CAU 1670]MDF2232844.1 shikimate kinase [Albimonas sp. CAU 1670]